MKPGPYARLCESLNISSDQMSRFIDRNEEREAIYWACIGTDLSHCLPTELDFDILTAVSWDWPEDVCEKYYEDLNK